MVSWLIGVLVVAIIAASLIPIIEQACQAANITNTATKTLFLIIPVVVVAVIIGGLVSGGSRRAS
jgi:hypothetical protein